jgi:hypothetical protein
VPVPSMRKLLERSSVAQSLDGLPSDGEPAFPRNCLILGGDPNEIKP